VFMTVVADMGIGVAAAAIGLSAVLRALAPSVFSVTACCGLLLVAYRRTARANATAVPAGVSPEDGLPPTATAPAGR
jgi:hypothetical protein